MSLSWQALSMLALLIASRKGTLPGSRSYGLMGDALDRNTASAVNEFAIDVQEACDEWIPSIAVVVVRRSADADGTLGMSVEVAER